MQTNQSVRVTAMNLTARSLSFILHPMLMPVYVLFFVFNGNSIFSVIPYGTKLYCYVVTIFAFLIMPLISLPLFRHLGLINSYDLEDKQERVYPILIAVAFAFLGFWLLGRLAYTNIVQQLYLVLIILLSAFSVVTLRWKMSMHMTAIGGLCGFLLILGIKYAGDTRNSFMILLLLAGVLASCRLYLEKHTPVQVYVGFLFGLFAVVGILGFLFGLFFVLGSFFNY